MFIEREQFDVESLLELLRYNEMGYNYIHGMMEYYPCCCPTRSDIIIYVENGEKCTKPTNSYMRD